MATDSKTSVAPSAMPDSVNQEIERVLESGLGDLSLRELLGVMLSGLGLAERKAYLKRSSADKANGFYERSLLAAAAETSARVACRVTTPAATRRRARRCCLGCSARAARSRPPRTR